MVANSERRWLDIFDELKTQMRISSAGVFDDNYKPDLHFSNFDGELMSLSETDGAPTLIRVAQLGAGINGP
ncbi:hypothetical protein N8637_00945 [Verrucomicrobia bacterium]|nr:hypothetical protein [Verrucomicrobiota bacterium]MDB4803861.1 hypothetical protein [Verrucomicrobiota bacterium]